MEEGGGELIPNPAKEEKEEEAKDNVKHKQKFRDYSANVFNPAIILTIG